jgi:hypothetical protein
MKLQKVHSNITGIIIAIICCISLTFPIVTHADVFADVTKYTTSVTATVVASTAKFILAFFNIHPENAKVPQARMPASIILFGTSTPARTVKNMEK